VSSDRRAGAVAGGGPLRRAALLPCTGTCSRRTAESATEARTAPTAIESSTSASGGATVTGSAEDAEGTDGTDGTAFVVTVGTLDFEEPAPGASSGGAVAGELN
jgi:hypothetical protein